MIIDKVFYNKIIIKWKRHEYYLQITGQKCYRKQLEN